MLELMSVIQTLNGPQLNRLTVCVPLMKKAVNGKKITNWRCRYVFKWLLWWDPSAHSIFPWPSHPQHYTVRINTQKDNSELIQYCIREKSIQHFKKTFLGINMSRDFLRNVLQKKGDLKIQWVLFPEVSFYPNLTKLNGEHLWFRRFGDAWGRTRMHRVSLLSPPRLCHSSSSMASALE